MRKKKITKLVITVCTAAAITVVGQMTDKNESGNLTIGELAVTSDANAECIHSDYPFMNTGICFELTGNCYWDPDADPFFGCDPYAFQY